MGHQRDAARQHLGTRGLDLDRAKAVVGALEGDAVVGARTFAVFELGLGDGGSKSMSQRVGASLE